MQNLIRNRFLLLLIAVMPVVSCGVKNSDKEATVADSTQVASEEIIKDILIEEDIVSPWNESLNVDSPAFWTDGEQNLVIATMKEGHGLIVYEAETGEEIRRISEPGNKHGNFERPNGIWVIDDYCFVVERDNRRVQVLKLPSLKTIGTFAEEKLIKPYGISIYEGQSGYEVYITDNYENELEDEIDSTDEDEIPADSLLGKRVLHYKVMITENGMAAKFERYIGETNGEGIIKVAESIYADPENNNLLIAEEFEPETCVKVYNLETGKYSGTQIGKGRFQYQAEGIALYDKGNGEGYWFLTDQEEGDNTFFIHDRKTFEFLGSFKSKTTQNTDGVWLTRHSFGKFDNGIFIPVHNDGGIGIFDLNRLFEKLNLEK